MMVGMHVRVLVREVLLNFADGHLVVRVLDRRNQLEPLEQQHAPPRLLQLVAVDGSDIFPQLSIVGAAAVEGVGCRAPRVGSGAVEDAEEQVDLGSNLLAARGEAIASCTGTTTPLGGYVNVGRAARTPKAWWRTSVGGGIGVGGGGASAGGCTA